MTHSVLRRLVAVWLLLEVEGGSDTIRCNWKPSFSDTGMVRSDEVGAVEFHYATGIKLDNHVRQLQLQ